MKIPIKILHLEDDINDRELIKEILSEEFICDFVCVDTYNDFSNKLKQENFNLIISDYNIPSFDVNSALAIVKDKYPDIPFIFVSGTIGEERAIECLKKGATDYVLKNNLLRLKQVVHRALRESKEYEENKSKEKKIKEQAALLDITTDAIIVEDTEHNILFWNKGAEIIYGYKNDEVLGKKSYEKLFDMILNKEITSNLFYKSQEELRKANEIIIAKGEWKGELNQVTKTGNLILVESKWVLMNDGRILIVNTDITEKKKIESQLFHVQRLESIGTLASGIAHDLNNILNPILLSAELLITKQLDEDSQELISMMKTMVLRGSDLVKQILTFARKNQIERKVIELKDVISEINKIIQQTFPKSLNIQINIPENLKLISVDTTQIHQVLMNLCVNARDAMPDGGTLSILAYNMYIDDFFEKSHVDAKKGSYIVISISDTGPGIPNEIINKIYEPFFTTKEPGKGTGLGLSTSIGIIKSHGGFMMVSSEKNKGTTFKVFIPVFETNESENDYKTSSEILEGNGELVLFVDDEKSILEVSKRILEVYNYNTLTVNNGTDAVVTYLKNKDKINVVVMDMIMPDMGGVEAISLLRDIKNNVKIIYTSGLKPDHFENTQNEIFLQKPYTAEDLLKILRRILSD